TVAIPAGNSANSFTITTSPVVVGTTVRVDATAGGVTKSQFINVGPDPNAPPLLSSVTLAAASVSGGTSVAGTVLLSGAAPARARGVPGTLAPSNRVAKPHPLARVPAGPTSASFTVPPRAVSTNAPVTITASFGATARTASLTVLAGAAPPPPAPGTPGTPS